MDTATPASDRAYCRAALPRVSRTFAVNIRLLRGPLGEAVRVGYLLCRAADTLEDSWAGEPDEIRARFATFLAVVAGDGAAAESLARAAAAIAGARGDIGLVARLPAVWRVFRSLPEEDRSAIQDGVATLATGMSRYAARAAERPRGVPYLDTEGELHDYCWVVAGCVGVMLTRLFGARSARVTPAQEARRFALAPVVGEALQLTNILLDWPVDLRRGRCYLPAAWLEEHGLSPAALIGTGRPGVREVAARLEALARAALNRVPDYLDLVPARHVRYRLFCLWPALWAQASLVHARRDPEFPWGARRPRLPRAELWRLALGSLPIAHRAGAVRRRFASMVSATAG
jgi:farnesyl-diphosphate farnesyltransferase